MKISNFGFRSLRDTAVTLHAFAAVPITLYVHEDIGH